MQTTLNFNIDGGRKLHGTIDINSSKNGAVALLCASLINRGTTTLTRVPKIEEVNRLIEVLRSIGVGVVWHGSTVTITQPKKFTLSKIDRGPWSTRSPHSLCRRQEVANLALARCALTSLRYKNLVWI